GGGRSMPPASPRDSRRALDRDAHRGRIRGTPPRRATPSPRSRRGARGDRSGGARTGLLTPWAERGERARGRQLHEHLAVAYGDREGRDPVLRVGDPGTRLEREGALVERAGDLRLVALRAEEATAEDR